MGALVTIGDSLRPAAAPPFSGRDPGAARLLRDRDRHRGTALLPPAVTTAC
jgi:hypothetical protein